MLHQEIIEQLPYSEPFLFVDELFHVAHDGVSGVYTFPKEAYFYQGHFKNHPVTPGVLLTECMAQIGVVCLGIYLVAENKQTSLEGLDTNMLQIALSSSDVQYFAPVFPGEQVRVVSKKIYFRFHKLKCEVSMYNSQNKVVCHGTIAGMIKPRNDE